MRLFSWWRSGRPLERVTVGGFLLALALPSLDHVLRPEARAVERERRKHAPWPTMPRGLEQFAAVTTRFQRAFEDRLGGRDLLLAGRAQLLVEGLGVTSTATIPVGDDGWLFYD